MMLNIIPLIKCPACKETVNSFTISGGSGRCPHCNFIFSSARQVISNTGLRQLKKDKKEYLKSTMTKAQVKTMFKLSEKQISKIPVAAEFMQIRYRKVDVVKAVHRSFERNVVSVAKSEVSGIIKKNHMQSSNENKSEKKYLRNGKPSYFEDETHLRTVWLLHYQFTEPLTQEQKDEINQFVRESGDSNLWEI